MYCLRALAPMPAAVAALGAHRAGTRFMYLGPGAHMVTYPVGGASQFLNILAAVFDKGPWTAPQLTAPGARDEVTVALGGWTAAARAVAGLLPERLDKWALFDMLEAPAEGYAEGCVCLAGDAAHAAGPHLGAGAAAGIEDALALAAVLESVDRRVGGEAVGAELRREALRVFGEVRYERTQWIVRQTRRTGEMFHWRDPEVGGDGEKFGKAITEMFHRIWNYDVDGMVREAVEKLDNAAAKFSRG